MNSSLMKAFLPKLLLVWTLLAASRASIAQLGQVSVSGNKFMVDGKAIVFRGLDASDPDKLAKDGHWNKEYFEAVKSWGANIVRFPVHPTAWRNRGRNEYLKLLDSGVKWATDLSLYVIIDWHSIGNLRTEMYQSPMYETTRKETFEFSRTMAGRYKGNTTVPFFEFFNEPTVMNGQLGLCSWKD